MENNPLVSIAVLSYKNLEYLSECLNSIFLQTYSNIELIISNDGADGFDEDTVKLYAEEKRTNNIRNIIVNKNAHNVGTVKHCNIVLDLSNGEYIMFIACDDAYNNKDVVNDMVNGFKTVPPDAMSIVCQTEMRDKDLIKCLDIYVKKHAQKLINELSPYELYKNHLVLYALFPAASRIYKRESFEKYGRFDENYFLIEDATSSISHAKQGMKTYYLDIVGVNHRDGGVSHTEFSRESFAHKMYLLDTIKLYDNSLLDKSISADVLDKVNYKYVWWMRKFCEIWGNGLPIELMESIYLGEYISNHIKSLESVDLSVESR